MKAVILAGGFGTRISEESRLKPKPMIEIGEFPILWHIMKIYAANGITDFIICAGYKQHIIKEFFNNYYLYSNDVSFDYKNHGKATYCTDHLEPWNVIVVDTGLHTMTGGRIKRISKYVKNETFCVTYGDGVSDVPIKKLVEFHKKCGNLATLTAVRPEGRFGIMEIEGNKITDFREKKKDDMGWINGGYMVLEPGVMDYIDGDSTIFEQEPIEGLIRDGQMNAFKHKGFWQCMDTVRDMEKLQALWATGKAPWKVW